MYENPGGGTPSLPLAADAHDCYSLFTVYLQFYKLILAKFA